MAEFSTSQKEYLDDLFMKLSTNVNKKFTEVTEQIWEIKENINKVGKKHSEEVKKLKEKNQQLENEINFLQKKVRKNNIVVYGIDEKENKENDKGSVISTLNKLLEINFTERDVSDIYRLGKQPNKKRPILLELISHQNKKLILKNAKKLKGKNIFIAEDQTWEDREKNKVLVKHLKKAKAKGKKAQIKGNKLIIENQAYTSEELQNSCEDTEIEEEEGEDDNISHTTATAQIALSGETIKHIREPEQRNNTYDATKTLNKPKITLKKNLRSNTVTATNKHQPF